MIAALAGLLVSRSGIGQGLATIIVWGGIVLAVSGALWGGYEMIKHRGAEEVRDRIEERNNEAGIKGGEARMSLHDCVDRGGLYDFRRGVCTWP